MESSIREIDLQLHEKVGSGASGEVYRATWTSPDRGQLEVAAKKIPLPQDGGHSFLEIDILKNLNHKNVIKYYGQVVTPNDVFIVTEFASKGTLRKFLKDRDKLTPQIIHRWAVQAARGIRYLTNAGVVHRDIKTANFLITSNDTLKICDFGIAKQQISTESTQGMRGTSSYLAPEVIKDGKSSHKADVFAFGIVLWELNTCLIPYRSMIPQHVMFKVASGELRPEVPAVCPVPEHKTLMQECWSQDRLKRPSIDEVVARVERAGML